MSEYGTGRGTRIFLTNAPPVIVAMEEPAVRERIIKNVSRFMTLPVLMDWQQVVASVGNSPESYYARDERISKAEPLPTQVTVNKDHIVLLQTVYWSVQAGVIDGTEEKAAA